MREMKLTLLTMAISLSFSGCVFSIGENQSQCEGLGCDYSRAGVCTDLVTTYKNRDTLKDRKVLHRWYWFDIDPYYEDEE